MERGNELLRRARTSDLENYVNGYVKLVFEYSAQGKPGKTETGFNGVVERPDDVTMVLAEASVYDAFGEIGDLSPYYFAGKFFVVACWDEVPMLVDSISVVKEVQHFVASRLTMGPQLDQVVEELGRYSLGQSARYGCVKPCRSFGEGELDFFALPVRGGEGRDAVPVGVVESRSETVECVTGNDGRFIRDGFVLFGVSGALPSVGVCFNDVTERPFIVKKLVKLVDVFRGPIDFQVGVLGHGK